MLLALQPVAESFDALDVRYYVGGSVASSARGLPRASLDVDVVAELRSEHVAPLVQRLASAFYLDEARVQAGVVARRSFNLIHLDTMLKVDVFVSKGRPFDIEAQGRARSESLGEGAARSFRIASAEDIVLAKLEWYRDGGEVSERQWGDVLGVLKMQGGNMDVAYLRRWAPELRLASLLERALKDADET